MNTLDNGTAECRDLQLTPVALRREIEARVSTSRPASEPTKTPQIFDMSRDDGLFSRIQPLREHVPDVADLRDVASDQRGPLFPQGVVEHVPPSSLLNLTQRRPEHGGSVTAPAAVASVFGGSGTDLNSMFAAPARARSRNEADVQFMSSLPQKSSLYEQYMRVLLQGLRGVQCPSAAPMSHRLVRLLLPLAPVMYASVLLQAFSIQFLML